MAKSTDNKKKKNIFSTVRLLGQTVRIKIK